MKVNIKYRMEIGLNFHIYFLRFGSVNTIVAVIPVHLTCDFYRQWKETNFSYIKAYIDKHLEKGSENKSC